MRYIVLGDIWVSNSDESRKHSHRANALAWLWDVDVKVPLQSDVCKGNTLTTDHLHAEIGGLQALHRWAIHATCQFASARQQRLHDHIVCRFAAIDAMTPVERSACNDVRMASRHHVAVRQLETLVNS